MFKLSGVGVQVAGLVGTPGVSWGADQVLLKLFGDRVQVAGLVTTPGGSGMATKFCGSCKILWCRLQDLLQYLEEEGVATMSC